MNRYISILRVSLLTTAIALIFDGGFVLPVTKQLSDNTVMYMADVGVGVFARVEPNELNTLTAQISERERELNAREAALSEREIQARSYTTNDPVDYSTYILSLILFVLTVLVVLNYAMDFARARHSYYERATT
jgi:hypothetical protein